MTSITAILGSVTPPGRLSSAVSGGLSRVKARSHTTTLLDLGQMNIGFADGRPIEQLTDDTGKLVTPVAQAEALVLATPVYRATLTGALKNALDLLPVEELQGKPVAVIAMGASLHHYLGPEAHLRDILAWFGAVQLPTSVYLSSADFSEGQLTEGAAGQLDALLETLVSFADAVRTVTIGPKPLAAR